MRSAGRIHEHALLPVDVHVTTRGVRHDHRQGVEPDEPFVLTEADALEARLGVGKSPVADIVGHDDGSRSAIRHRFPTVLQSALSSELERALSLGRGEDEPVEDARRAERWSRRAERWSGFHGGLDRCNTAEQYNDRRRQQQTIHGASRDRADKDETSPNCRRDSIVGDNEALSPANAIDRIVIRGAREHNLKNIDLEIPRDQLVVITGLSGSGKSSLAFDTIYAEGQRRYVESLSAYARQFLEQMEKPDVDSIDGLSPAISIEQKTTSKNPRSTVGT